MPKPNKAKVDKRELAILLKAAIEVDSYLITCCFAISLVYKYNRIAGYNRFIKLKDKFSSIFSPDGYKYHYSYWPDFSPKSQRERVLALLFFREMLRTGDV